MSQRTFRMILIILCVSALTVILCDLAKAQALAPVTAAGSDWTGLIIIAVIVLLVAVVIVIHRRFPTQASQADAAVKAETLKVAGEIRDHLKALVEKAPAAPTPAPAPVEPTPTQPAGKNGVAGVLSLTVTGDPKADLAAFQAAYFS